MANLNNNTERWKPIEGFDYEVSDFGKVRNTTTHYVLSSRPRAGRYVWVCLFDGNGKRFYFPVHRLVAIAFIGPPPTPKHEVNHKDFDRSNNHVFNLEWLTHPENLQHAKSAGRVGGGHSEKWHASKLSNKQVREMRRLNKEKGLKAKALGPMFGVSVSHTFSILRNEWWRHV